MSTRMLAPALELMTAYARSKDDPGFFREALQRVIAESLTAADPAWAMTEAFFGLSALSGILLEHLSDATAITPAEVLTDVHRVYLAPAASGREADLGVAGLCAAAEGTPRKQASNAVAPIAGTGGAESAPDRPGRDAGQPAGPLQ